MVPLHTEAGEVGMNNRYVFKMLGRLEEGEIVLLIDDARLIFHALLAVIGYN